MIVGVTSNCEVTCAMEVAVPLDWTVTHWAEVNGKAELLKMRLDLN